MKLKDKVDIQDRMIDVLSSVVNDNIMLLKRNTCEKTEMEARKKGSYPFIPNGFCHVLEQFIVLKKYMISNGLWNALPKSKFLDAGCGIGNIMLLAYKISLCRDIYGLELFQYNINTAKRFFNMHIPPYYQDRLHILRRNILKYKDYGKYDIIYYYCPLEDRGLEEKFELMVENQMKKGAILIPHYKQNLDIVKDKRFKEITLKGYHGNLFHVFIKVKE